MKSTWPMDKIAETVVLKKLTFELKNRPVSPVMMKSNGRFLITRKTFVILKKSNACRNIADLKKMNESYSSFCLLYGKLFCLESMWILETGIIFTTAEKINAEFHSDSNSVKARFVKINFDQFASLLTPKTDECLTQVHKCLRCLNKIYTRISRTK